tara:strand:+ start:2231 stop:2878 length:648 start_codon:yes stop_codon:yes gene_type:complete
MNENIAEAKYDITKKTRIKKFYEKNKKLIYSVIIFIILSGFAFIFYLENKENKKISLADEYIKAKIFINNGEKDKAKILLEKVIYENDPTYSSLSLFLLLNHELIKDNKKINDLFDHILKNNEFESEIKNLMILKKLISQFDRLEESELLNMGKTIISSNSIWKPHVLLLFGDYFVSKKEYIKAREFYQKVIAIKDINQELYDQAALQLRIISND